MTRPVLRFVTNSTHPPYGHRSGLFQVAYGLRRQDPSIDMRCRDLRDNLAWFDKNLAEPPRLSPSRYPRAKATALSWVKPSAVEHVRRLRRLAELVEILGQIEVHELRTDRPGYIVFEDDHQVVALPFADTPR